MSAALRLAFPTDLDEFLAWERGQELRYEWDGVQPIAMVGGTLAHSLLASRLAAAIERRLPPGCTVFRSDAKVLTAEGSRARYPDLVVTCSAFRPGDLAVPDPLVIVEVLSEGTAAADLGIKRQEYAALPSLARYVAISNEARLAHVFARATGFAAEEMRDALHLPEFDLTLPLATLYEGLIAG